MSWAEEARATRAANSQIRMAEKREEARIAEERRNAEAERHRRDRAHAAALKAEARQQRRDVWKERWAAMPDAGLSALLATLVVLPLLLTWDAQARFAADFLHISAPLHNGFPAVVELGAWWCAFKIERRRRAGQPIGSLAVRKWALALTAAGINFGHGMADGGVVAGVGLSVLSLIGLVLHDSNHLSTTTRQGTRVRPGLAIWRRVRYPRLSLTAASIAAARGIDPASAWTLAWEDRFGVGPDSTKRDRTLGKLVVSRELTADRQLARDGGLWIENGQIVRELPAEITQRIEEERVAALAEVAAERDAAEAEIARLRQSAEAEYLDAIDQARAAEEDAQVQWAAAKRARVEAQQLADDATEVMLSLGFALGPDVLPQGSEPGDTADEQREQVMSPRAAELLPHLLTAIDEGSLPAAPGVKRIRAWVTNSRRESLGVPTAQELRNLVQRRTPTEPSQDYDQGDESAERAA